MPFKKIDVGSTIWHGLIERTQKNIILPKISSEIEGSVLLENQAFYITRSKQPTTFLILIF